MSSLTRWVLAHKRIVVIGWIALTIAGIAASGPASKRLANDSSVPAKEGWETTVAIAERYDSNPDGGSVPLLPVVTLPAGTTVDSGVKAELAAADARRAATRADRVVCVDREPGVRLQERAHGVRARLSTAGGEVGLGREPGCRVNSSGAVPRSAVGDDPPNEAGLSLVSQ
jgi:hypothetical protein